MPYGFRLTILSALLLFPAAAAAAPANVTGIAAALEDGKVHVTWTKLDATDLAQYRVFYSHTSILDNNGLYDDYEQADASASELTLQTVPPVDTLYVAVLAVDTKGEESPLFQEEASVALRPGGAPAQPASQPASAQGGQAAQPAGEQDQELRLLSARAQSATGILLSFSQNVVVDPAKAAQAFDVRDQNGAVLGLKRLVIEGKTVILHTVPQLRGVVYAVRVGASVTGKTEAGQAVALDASQGPVLFTGSPDGIDPAAVPAQTEPRDITTLRINASPDGQGAYTVEATWMVPAGATGLRVSQSADRGATFSAERDLSPDTQTLRVRGVPPGSFGVRIRTVTADGRQSRGVTDFLNLPALSASPLMGSIFGPAPRPSTPLPAPVRSTTLPNSGIGLTAAVSMAFALATGQRMRRRRTQAK